MHQKPETLAGLEVLAYCVMLMNKRFVVFISLVLLVLGIGSFYMGVRLMSWSPWLYAHQAGVWSVLFLVIFLQFLGPWVYRASPSPKKFTALYWATYIALGAFGSFFLYTLIVDAAMIWAEKTPELQRLRLLLTVGGALTTVLVGLIQALKGPSVYEVEIPVQGLPEAFEGFRIAQISDLHIGPTIGASYANKVTRIANGLHPDLIALTGDLGDGRVAKLTADLAPLAKLSAPAGTYFVTGNHEYYSNAPEWISAIRSLGARFLLNEHVRLRRGDAEIVIAGVSDWTAGGMLPSHACDPKKAIEGAPTASVKILLAHNPDTYKLAHALGYSLQLSGHTHGGQFFPWNFVVRLVHPYYRGLYRHKGLWIYVNRGTGYWGPPLRFLVPTEITLLRLKRA